MVSNPSAIRPTVRSPVVNKQLVAKILRNVSENKGFRFYLAIGEPTKEIAVSLMDFVEKLAAVDVQSVNFHHPRKDFEKWIREVLGDTELALRLGRINRVRLGIRGEALRSEILRTVKVRLSELKATP